MKLDKMQFATLINFIADRIRKGYILSDSDISYIDDIIDVEVPEPAPYRASVTDVDAMLRAICDNRKIDAIRYYRNLTGQGLKESKDAIEANWLRQPKVEA